MVITLVILLRISTFYVTLVHWSGNWVTSSLQSNNLSLCFIYFFLENKNRIASTQLMQLNQHLKDNHSASQAWTSEGFIKHVTCINIGKQSLRELRQNIALFEPINETKLKYKVLSSSFTGKSKEFISSFSLSEFKLQTTNHKFTVFHSS